MGRLWGIMIEGIVDLIKELAELIVPKGWAIVIIIMGMLVKVAIQVLFPQCPTPTEPVVPSHGAVYSYSQSERSTSKQNTYTASKNQWDGNGSDSMQNTSVSKARSVPTPSPCMGSPKRLSVGEWATVCTWSSREPVVMRTGPGKSYPKNGHELVPGAEVYVLEGPVCDDESKWWYWKVRTKTKGYVGWMAEGGDNKDAYFLCPSP